MAPDEYPRTYGINYGIIWLDKQTLLIGVIRYEFELGKGSEKPATNLLQETYSYDLQTRQKRVISPVAVSDTALGRNEIAYRTTTYRSAPVTAIEVLSDQTHIIARSPLTGKPLQILEPGCNYRWSPSETMLGYEVRNLRFYGCRGDDPSQPILRLVFANRQTNQVVTYPIPDAEQATAKVAGWVILTS